MTCLSRAVALLATTLALGALTSSPATATTATTATEAAVAASPEADRCYAAALVEVFLGHEATAVEILGATQVGADAPLRHRLPSALASSDAWLEAVVVGIYDDALDRAPDPSGLAYWIGRLRAGDRVATLTAAVYGADEVYVRAGSTAEGYVADVFPRIMGRSPTGADVAYWAGEVAGRGRGGVAKALVGSVENRTTRVTRLYRAVLDRDPDAAGRDFWVTRLATLDDVRLAASLAASQEAYDVAQSGCVVPPAPTVDQLTDGNASSQAPAVSADGRWVAFPSRASDLLGPAGPFTMAAPYLLDRESGTLTKVLQANRDVTDVSLSADGRHVTFVSEARDLLPESDLNPGRNDIYTWDRLTGVVTRVTDGNGSSLRPEMSADGRFIAFASSARSFDGQPTDSDVFLWDRTTGAITRVTGSTLVSTYDLSIAPDGSAIYFAAYPPAVETPVWELDTHRWERASGTTSLVATNALPLGVADDGDLLTVSYTPSLGSALQVRDATTGAVTAFAASAKPTFGGAISADGSTVAFTTHADDLVPGDVNGDTDVYLWERATGAVARISPPAPASARPSVSGDGRIVVFHSGQPVGPEFEVMLWDRGS